MPFAAGLQIVDQMAIDQQLHDIDDYNERVAAQQRQIMQDILRHFFMNMYGPGYVDDDDVIYGDEGFGDVE